MTKQSVVLISLVVAALWFCIFLAACGSNTKQGTVKGLVMIQGKSELMASVVLDDKTEVIAFPKVYSTPEGGGTKWELVKKGQRVEIEPHKEANSAAEWKIVRILEPPPEKWTGRIGTYHRDIEGGRSVHEVILDDGTKIEAEHDSRSEMLGWRTRVEVVEGGRYWKIVKVFPPEDVRTPMPMPFSSP